MKSLRSLTTLLTLFILVLVTVDTSQARTKLSKADVQKLFIGKTWRGPSGSFLFRKNGTYLYKGNNGGTFNGNYELKNDGTIRGATTNYKFYRKSNGDFVYYHSKSRKFLPAFLN